MSSAGQVFVQEIREALGGYDLQTQREKVATAVKRAMEADDLLAEWTGLLEERLEFHLLQEPTAAIKVFVMRPEQPKGPPHDHGGLWGCYATYRGHLQMDYYAVRDGGEKVAPLRHVEVPRGTLRFVEPSDIHQVWVQQPSIILTIYNGDLNNTVRRIFDLEQGRLIRDRSRWEERLHAGGGQQYRMDV